MHIRGRLDPGTHTPPPGQGRAHLRSPNCPQSLLQRSSSMDVCVGAGFKRQDQGAECRSNRKHRDRDRPRIIEVIRKRSNFKGIVRKIIGEGYKTPSALFLKKLSETADRATVN